MADWLKSFVRSPAFRKLVIRGAAIGAAYLTADQLGWVADLARAVAPCP